MIYLDNAATSYPKPPCIQEAILRALRIYGGNPGRSGHRLSLITSEAIYACRADLASFLGCDAPEHIIFTYNASYALNMAIRAFVRSGDHVLCSDMEHNAVYRPLYALQEAGTCCFDCFSTDGDILASLEAKRKAETSLLVCTHVSNVSGRVLPIDKIGEFCKKHHICFLLDASQSVGHLPCDMEKLGCDMLCAPAHKGLYGIQGCGFLAFRGALPLGEFLQGGSGVHSLSPKMPESFPERLEAGTLGTPAILALHAGIRFLSDVKVEEVAARERLLSNYLCERLDAVSSIERIREQAHGSGVISFRSSKMTATALGNALDDKGICVRSGLHCAPLAHRSLGTLPDGTVRVSLGYLNTFHDIDGFCRVLREILG